MANYTVTAANVIASSYAIRFQPTPQYVSIGTPPILQANVNIAGTTITAGQPVYQATDTKFYLADANGSDPLYKAVGIAEHGASAGQPLSIVIKDPQFTPGITTLLVGDVVVVSATAGAVCPVADVAAGWFNTTLMVAYSTTQANLNPTRSDAVKV